MSELLERGERQIADGRLDRPAGDNAVETYRRLVAVSPDDALVARSLGNKLSAALWRAANEASEAQRWEEALRYFQYLDALPPVPLDALLSGAPSPNAKPAAEVASTGSSAAPPTSATPPAADASPADAATAAGAEDVPPADSATVARARGDELPAHANAGGLRPPPGDVYRLDPTALAYASYRNERYGLAVAYPKDLFPREEPIGQGEGRKFVSADGAAWFTASGERNEAGWTAGDLLKLSIAHHEERSARGPYTRLGDHWYVVSSAQNGRIVYEKGIVSRDGRTAGTLLIEYPLSRKTFFDPIVTRMSRSFQPAPAPASAPASAGDRASR